jgi:hypothetical protein
VFLGGVGGGDNGLFVKHYINDAAFKTSLAPGDGD